MFGFADPEGAGVPSEAEGTHPSEAEGTHPSEAEGTHPVVAYRAMPDKLLGGSSVPHFR